MSEELKTGYDWNQTEFALRFNGGTAAKPAYVTHILERPTLVQLQEREKLAAMESVSASGGDEIETDNIKADLTLWRAIVRRVSGYKAPGIDPAIETQVGQELADRLPAAHKLRAIQMLTATECEIEREEANADEYFDLGAETVRVVQTIHGCKVVHELRNPNDKEYAAFKPVKVSTTKAGKQTGTRIQGNLRAFVELYDKLIQTVDGEAATFKLRTIDPLSKRAVINCLLDAYNVTAQD